MEILMTLSIIPYLKILYPQMGSPTTPGPQAPPPSKSGAGSVYYYLLLPCITVITILMVSQQTVDFYKTLHYAPQCACLLGLDQCFKSFLILTGIFLIIPSVACYKILWKNTIKKLKQFVRKECILTIHSIHWNLASRHCNMRLLDGYDCEFIRHAEVGRESLTKSVSRYQISTEKFGFKSICIIDQMRVKRKLIYRLLLTTRGTSLA